MSNDALSWAFNLQGISPTDKHVLLNLADFADEVGSCYPSRKTIARRTGLSTRTVERALESLQTQGLLAASARHQSGRQTTNRYHLHVGTQLSTEGDTVTTPPRGGRHSDAHVGRHNDEGEGDTVTTPGSTPVSTLMNPQRNPQKEGTRASAPQPQPVENQPTRCPRHQGADNPPPCRNCAEAREAHEAQAEAAKRAAAAMSRQERQQSLEQYLAAIRDCDICDNRGIHRSWRCTHNAETEQIRVDERKRQAEINRAGLAQVDAARENTRSIA